MSLHRPSSPQHLAAAAWRKAIAVGLAFGLTGGLLGAHRIAAATLNHIITPETTLSYQEVSDLLPVPRLLDWNLTLIETLRWLQQINGPLLWAVGALLLVLLGWLSLTLARESVIFQNIEESGKGETEDSGSADQPIEAQETANAEEIALKPAAEKRTTRKRALVPCLALFALSVSVLLRWGLPSLPETLLRYYHTLGTFHQEYWLHLALHSLGSIVALWFAVGVLFYIFARAGLPLSVRLSLVPLPLLLFGLAFWWQRPLQLRAISAQRDWSPNILADAPPYLPAKHIYGVPDGTEAGQELAKLVHLKQGNQPEQPERSLVLFFPRGPLNAQQQGFTEDGLTASPASAGPVRAFLERRHYETALSWTAIKHLYNVAVVHFDTTGAISDCLFDMERCPHLSQCGFTTRNMLFTCAASPQNLALVDEWADERQFAHPTRQSQRLMGDLYLRFGAVKQALTWYRRAEMPNSFLEKVQNEKPLFHQGRITGTLTWNGKPIVGVQVGAVPRRLNGLPADLEPSVFQAGLELAAFRTQAELFPVGNPRPFSFRWISVGALTDATGHFTLENLTEGEYMLVCTLPPNIKLGPPGDPRLSVSNAPDRLVLNYNTPSCDLGTIGLTLSQ